MPSSVLVSIVTYDSERYINACIRSVLAQTHHPLNLIVSDNASADGSASRVEAEFGTAVHLIRHDSNLGFARAHNLAIQMLPSDYVLTLNPDAILNPSFVEILSVFMDLHPELGSATGKLMRMDAHLQPVRRNSMLVLDSTGIQFLPNQRHKDRGGGEQDHGQFEVEELVFGTTAAAGFYRRRMLEDISLDGQIFDEQFFVYREDVDLAWRAQLYGWPCGYQPRALAYHVRQGIPERRSLLSATINYHSVKNRFLLRIKNMPWSMYLRHIPVITSRDLLVVAYAVLKEHYSLRAIPFLRKNWKLYLRYRAEIESNRRVPQREIAKWIGWKPRSFPLHSE